jgi:folate-dependent phosphoribosylglycinamide formyltransferase PurN
MRRYRALFLAGAVPVAAAAMRGWLAAGHEIAAHWIPSLPRRGMVHRDARLGWLAPRWSTAAVTRRHGIPAREVPRLAGWPERIDAARGTGADVLISAHFPFLVPPDMLALFGPRAVNLHPAPLPRYRGKWALYAMMLDRGILADAAMTLHVMTEDFDEGPIIGRRPVALGSAGDWTRLELAMARAARQLAFATLPAYLDGRIEAEPQDPALASHPRVSAADVAIGPRLSGEAARWLCATIGRHHPLEVASLSGVKIVGVDRDLGPPTCAPPRLSSLAVEMDLADRRFRFRRKRPWTTPVRKLRELAIQLSERDGD